MITLCSRPSRFLPFDNGNCASQLKWSGRQRHGSLLMSSSASSWLNPTLCGWCLTDLPYTIATRKSSTMVLWMALHLDGQYKVERVVRGPSHHLQNLQQCTSWNVAQPVGCSQVISPWAWCTPDRRSLAKIRFVRTFRPNGTTYPHEIELLPPNLKSAYAHGNFSSAQ